MNPAIVDEIVRNLSIYISNGGEVSKMNVVMRRRGGGMRVVRRLREAPLLDVLMRRARRIRMRRRFMK